MSWKDACGYWIGQFIGGIIGAAVLFWIVSATGAPGAMGSPEGLGTTDEKKGAGNLAGLAIGLTLILIHLVCINLTGTSVNPARSFGPALFVGGAALKDVWVFIAAPLAGGAIAALVWNCIAGECCCKCCKKAE